MQLATRSGAEVSDTLKYLSERIPATFVYAGIDLERQGLFSGIRGSQIAGRFTLIPTLPFPLAGEWRGPGRHPRRRLRLRHHQAGTLPGLDRYLHQRTSGMIGSLSHLIRGAAIEAIQSGTEQITKKLLDTIDIDHAAQRESGPGRLPPAAPRPAGDRRSSAAAAAAAADPARARSGETDLFLYPPSRCRQPPAPDAPAPLPHGPRHRRRLPARLACRPGRTVRRLLAACARRPGASRRHRLTQPPARRTPAQAVEGRAVHAHPPRRPRARPVGTSARRQVRNRQANRPRGAPVTTSGPAQAEPPRGSRLDAFTAIIDDMLQAGLQAFPPQRQPVISIYRELVTRHGADGISYQMVRNTSAAGGQ